MNGADITSKMNNRSTTEHKQQQSYRNALQAKTTKMTNLRKSMVDTSGKQNGEHLVV